MVMHGFGLRGCMMVDHFRLDGFIIEPLMWFASVRTAAMVERLVMPVCLVLCVADGLTVQPRCRPLWLCVIMRPYAWPLA